MSDSLSVIIIILIIAIVLDGLRRARLSRRGKVKLSPNARKADAYFSADEDKSSASIISPARRKALAEQALLEMRSIVTRHSNDQRVAIIINGLVGEDALHRDLNTTSNTLHHDGLLQGLQRLRLKSINIRTGTG